jgi:hypothetical protein
LDDTALNDDGAQVLALSCHRLQYTAVGGTYVTAVGVMALAQRCTWARAAAGTHAEKMAIHIEMPICNLEICHLTIDVEIDFTSLRARFPSIYIVGANWDQDDHQ